MDIIFQKDQEVLYLTNLTIFQNTSFLISTYNEKLQGRIRSSTREAAFIFCFKMTPRALNPINFQNTGFQIIYRGLFIDMQIGIIGGALEYITVLYYNNSEGFNHYIIGFKNKSNQ